MPQTEQVAHRLATIRAAREVVPSDPNHSARWHRHGVPSPFSRWNHHPEYEVHLITAGTGWYVVGDRIDVFSAGQLVLVGSNVPHHWISDLAPGERLPERDVVFQFHPQWIDRCADLLPEVATLRVAAARSPAGESSSSDPPGTPPPSSCRPSAPTEGAARLAHIFGLLGLLCRTHPRASGAFLAAEWSTSHASSRRRRRPRRPRLRLHLRPPRRPGSASGGHRSPRRHVGVRVLPLLRQSHRGELRRHGAPTPTGTGRQAAPRHHAARRRDRPPGRLRQPLQLQPTVPRPPRPHPRGEHRG